jgi:hypothetical protein
VPHIIRLALAALILAGLGGCATVNNPGAGALASAGQGAADALTAQVTISRNLVALSSQRALVTEALRCKNVRPELQAACLQNVRATSLGHDKHVQEVADILRQRQLVLGALKDAYAAFGELVAYDARGEVDKSFSALGGTLDGLLAAMALPPGAGPAIKNLTGDLLGMAASYRKDKQILVASRALHHAVDTLAFALGKERDRVANASLVQTMIAEQDTLYDALVDNGLVGARVRDELAAYVAAEFPGMELTPPPPSGETPFVLAAARISYTAASAERARAAVASYEQALDALRSLSAQHARLEAGAPLDLAALMAHAKELQQLAKDITHS